MEEPADAINHLAFHIQEHPDDPANPEYLLAIQDLARAYERIRKAREP
jgi:ribosomal protein S15P/S13E